MVTHAGQHHDPCVRRTGTIFDNILVTDDVAYARQFAEETWGASKDAEKAMYDEYAAEQERIRKEEADKVWQRLSRSYRESEH